MTLMEERVIGPLLKVSAAPPELRNVTMLPSAQHGLLKLPGKPEKTVHVPTHFPT